MSQTNESMKRMSLIMLVLQNTSLILTMRYSLVSPDTNYVSSTAVASMEVVKLTICSLVIFFDSEHGAGSSTKFQEIMKSNLIDQPKQLMMLAVPSLLYTVQNNLLFIALDSLEVATFQVCYQLKILTTALFSVFMLNKQISPRQWQSLVLLMIGVALVQTSNLNSDNDDDNYDKITEHHNPFLGLICILAACCTSGFAGVYFEKILKGSKPSIWVRNVQMGITATASSIIAVYVKDGDLVQEGGFFQGYGATVYSVIMLQAGGGLLVAMVVKYADNILKGFATSLSIIVSCVLSAIIFDFAPNLQFLLGTVAVLGSVYIYNSNIIKIDREVDAAV